MIIMTTIDYFDYSIDDILCIWYLTPSWDTGKISKDNQILTENWRIQNERRDEKMLNEVAAKEWFWCGVKLESWFLKAESLYTLVDDNDSLLLVSANAPEYLTL